MTRRGAAAVREETETDPYRSYAARKKVILAALLLLVVLVAVVAVNAGSMRLDPLQVLRSVLGNGNQVSGVVIWRIRLPRILAAIVAGAGLSVAGCVIQNTLRNPLASPSTLGISSAAAFGANLAIIVFGAGTIRASHAETITIDSPYLVTASAFVSSAAAAVVILLLARIRGFSPEAMVLAGVALSSLFSAGTMLVQYFAEDLQIAAVVFWTFGDLGRVAWREVAILAGLTVVALGAFVLRRWDYNALDSGEETAKSLGVNVERVRRQGMLVACTVTAAVVSFVGIIGFIGLVGPQIMRRIIGGDHRYLVPASALMGSLLLLVSDTLARTMVSPAVLPVGAITAFFGAPLFLYLLVRGYQRR